MEEFNREPELWSRQPVTAGLLVPLFVTPSHVTRSHVQSTAKFQTGADIVNVTSRAEVELRPEHARSSRPLRTVAKRALRCLSLSPATLSHVLSTVKSAPGLNTAAVRLHVVAARNRTLAPSQHLLLTAVLNALRSRKVNRATRNHAL